MQLRYEFGEVEVEVVFVLEYQVLWCGVSFWRCWRSARKEFEMVRLLVESSVAADVAVRLA